MLPFTTESKRNINLGGATSQSSHSVILDRARALRNSRRDERRKEDAAIKIQRWLSSQRETQAIRADLRVQFDLGPGGGLPVDGGEAVRRSKHTIGVTLLHCHLIRIGAT
jgi:hypothetical protein